MSLVDGPETVLEVDARHRIPLGKLARADVRRYLASSEPDGTIILRPAVVMSELEARYLAHPELVAEVERRRAAARTDPRSVVRRK